MKKLTTYEEVKNYCMNNVGGIDIDLYTDEEFIQLQKWLIQAEQECLNEENENLNKKENKNNNNC